MSIETVEEIKARWNEPVSNYGTERMIGDRVPEGDGRATVALGNPNSPDSPFSDRVDASLPKGVETLTPANGAVAGTDKSTMPGHCEGWPGLVTPVAVRQEVDHG
jgi:hypothetical protein